MALRERPDDNALTDGAADIRDAARDGGPTTAAGNGAAAAVRHDASSIPGSAAELERANERLEAANRELWRENARLARDRLGRAGAAAAAELVRFERDLHARASSAEARVEVLERLLATPRHQAVERARDRVMRSRLLYGLVRRLWALAARR